MAPVVSEEERARLEWLDGRVGATADRPDGVPASGLAPADAVRVLAVALRRIHDLPAPTCPFDASPAAEVQRAWRRVLEGRGDKALFETALGLVPLDVDAVVTHGAATLDHVIVTHGGDVAVVGVGRLGVSDRWRDLATAAGSVARTFGEGWAAEFFAAYGVEPDPTRLSFWSLVGALAD